MHRDGREWSWKRRRGLRCAAIMTATWTFLRMADGRFAWEIAEDQADAVIAHVQSSHRKVHGQSYWKLAYIKGTLRTFLKANNIRA